MGRTFGRVAEAYERTRPDYPEEAIDVAVGGLGLPPEAVVLDLAAGTGKLTRALHARFARVIAVEPDDEMRAYVDGDARAGSAEAIPVEDGSVDAVFSGNAFHWFDTARALDEILRVLRPHGGLALLGDSWGFKEEPGLLPSPFADELDAIWARFHGDRREFASWRDEVERSPFGPLREVEVERRVRISGRDLVDLHLTASTPAALDDEERAAVAERAYPLMREEYEIRVRTSVLWARLP